MINLLYDHPTHPNVFTYGAHNDIVHLYNNFYSPKIKRICPWELHSLENTRVIFDHRNVDFFIYPILVHEPFYMLRRFVNPDNPDWGILSYLKEDVRERINKGEGVIYLSVSFEPPYWRDVIDVMSSLRQDKRFLVNIPSSGLVFKGFPGHIESFEIINSLQEHPVNKCFADYGPNKIVDFKKDFCLFNGRSEKHVGACLIAQLLAKDNLLRLGHCFFEVNINDNFQIAKKTLPDDSKIHDIANLHLPTIDDVSSTPIELNSALQNCSFNLVVEAYYNDQLNLGFPFITEKLWRNVHAKVPFVLVGQRYTLRAFRELGYKTFHPYIDESYDLLEDDERVFAVYREVKKLLELPNDKKNKLFLHLKHITDFNYNHFFTRLKDLERFLDYARFR